MIVVRGERPRDANFMSEALLSPRSLTDAKLALLLVLGPCLTIKIGNDKHK